MVRSKQLNNHFLVGNPQKIERKNFYFTLRQNMWLKGMQCDTMSKNWTTLRSNSSVISERFTRLLSKISNILRYLFEFTMEHKLPQFGNYSFTLSQNQFSNMNGFLKFVFITLTNFYLTFINWYLFITDNDKVTNSSL